VTSTSAPPLALVCSVLREAEPLIEILRERTALTVGRRAGFAGRLGARDVLVIPAGMGKTNAAQTVTALLETRVVSGVIGFGVGGAYAGSGLQPGGVAIATAEIYGDEGVDAPDGWISTSGIGIPLLEAAGACRFNEFPIDPLRVDAAMGALSAAGIEVVAGPFVTVSCCSGTAARGDELARRFEAVCESMEGAAFAHVAALYEVPYLEIRGISNLVEDRNLSRWKLDEAARAAAIAVAAVARI
jgi:futalosine hydrolase